MIRCPGCGNDNNDGSRFCSNCGYGFAGNQTGKLNPDTVLEGRYVVVKTIGQGGMGAVYLALDTRLKNMPVAIKEMSTRAVGGDLQAAIDSFEKEASMLISLKHNALPVIRDFFAREDNRWYLVMDYIEGHTLKEEIQQRGPVSEAEAVKWAAQLCDILSYLHDCSPAIIFRDLKPDNIMLTPGGNIKLIDFGIARHFQTGNSADTFAYGSSGFAPPEQYGQNQTDARSDIYALGATLHFLLTGIDPSKNPFRFELPSKYTKVSVEMEKAVMQALALKPEDRPQTMVEFKKLLPQRVSTIGQTGRLPETNNMPMENQYFQAKESPTGPLNLSAMQSATNPAAGHATQVLYGTAPAPGKEAGDRNDGGKSVLPHPATQMYNPVQGPAASPINGHADKPGQTKKIVLIAVLLLVIGSAALIRFTPLKEMIFTDDKQSGSVVAVNPNNDDIAVKENNEDTDTEKIAAGQYKVGDDISPGEYVIVQDNDFCHYEILADSSGDSSSIIKQGDIDGQVYINLETDQYIAIEGGHLISFPTERNTSSVAQFSPNDLSQYSNYTNPRFGFVIQYPAFFIPKPDPENGDGRAYISSDGKASLTVWGSNSPEVLNKSTRAYYEEDLANTEGTIGYTTCGETWYVISGARGDMSFYQKTFVGQEENSFLITMPTDQLDYYSKIIDVMEKKFHPGAGAEG